MSENIFKNKCVLITGAAGFLGTNVIHALLDRQALVRGTIHKTPPQAQDLRIEFIRTDLTNPADCARAVKGMDYVIMAAASTAGAGVMARNPLSLVTPNVVMNTLMLEAAYAADIQKFVFISSNAVYPPFDYPVREDEMMDGPPFEKYYPISWMKRFGEILCETYASKIERPMQTIVLRPANMYGPYDDFRWESSHMVAALVRKVIERMSPLEVWGGGTEIKDLIYVGDFVQGLLAALERQEEYRPLNIGTGIPVSVNDVLQAAMRVDGYHNAHVKYDTSKPTMIGKRMLDVSQASQVIGFRAMTSLEDGLRQTVNWYRQARPNGLPDTA